MPSKKVTSDLAKLAADSAKELKKLLAKAKKHTKGKLNRSPSMAPNVYRFTRAYDSVVEVGVENTSEQVYMNTDSTVQFLTLHTKFNKLPSWEEFDHLFSQYKITSIKHTLIPFYKNNVAMTATSIPSHFNAIPNYEIIILPQMTSVRHEDIADLDGDEFADFLNQSQRKSVRIMPSGKQFYWTKYPKVVGYSGPVDKDGGTATAIMQSPDYYSTSSDPVMTGGVDQTSIVHYGILMCIRRVDGQDISDHGAGSSDGQHMGFRLKTQVNFSCRKVQ